MPEPALARQAKVFSGSMLAVVLFVSLIQLAWWQFGDQITANGGFADGDSYTRLIRIQQLLDTGDWFDNTIPDANAPYGTSVHWTRLFDLIVLAVAAPMVPVIGVTQALFWAGTIVSPLLHVLTAAALAWALTPLLGRVAACFAGALSAAQAGVMVFGIVGRADHHMLFALLIAVSIGFLIRNSGTHGALSKYGFWAGLSIAFGIWVGPEFLLYMALCLSVLGLRWFFAPTPTNLKQNISMASGMTGGLLLALLIERGGSGFTAFEYDRLSIIHFVLGLFVLVFWVTLAFIERFKPDQTMVMRALTVAGGITICAATLVFLFPKIIGNPLNDADQAIQPIYAHISEYQPISDIARLFIYFGSALFAVPWLGWRLQQSYGSTTFWTWLLIGACLAVYMALGITWIRWCLYAGIFLSILIGDMIFFIDLSLSRRLLFPTRILVKAMVITGVATGPLIVGASILYFGKSDAQRLAEIQSACPVRDLSLILNDPPLNHIPQTIVASANFGPELIYRTKHKAVATVHHRNVSGILDGYGLFRAVEDQTAKTIIQKRAVTMLLLCPGSADDKYFLTDAPSGSLYHRLLNPPAPDWLKPVVLPQALNKHLKLFVVDRKRLGLEPIDSPGVAR